MADTDRHEASVQIAEQDYFTLRAELQHLRLLGLGKTANPDISGPLTGIDQFIEFYLQQVEPSIKRQPAQADQPEASQPIYRRG